MSSGQGWFETPAEQADRERYGSPISTPQKLWESRTDAHRRWSEDRAAFDHAVAAADHAAFDQAVAAEVTRQMDKAARNAQQGRSDVQRTARPGRRLLGE